MNPLPYCRAHSQDSSVFSSTAWSSQWSCVRGPCQAALWLEAQTTHKHTLAHTHTHTPLCDSRQSAWHCPPSDRGRPECQRAAMAATATDPSVSAEGDSITVTTGYIIHLRRALAGSVHEMGKIHECSIIFHSVNAFNSI